MKYKWKGVSLDREKMSAVLVFILYCLFRDVFYRVRYVYLKLREDWISDIDLRVISI